MKYQFQLWGKKVQSPLPVFYAAQKFEGVMLCLKVWLEPGKVQQAEILSVEELGQIMGGN